MKEIAEWKRRTRMKGSQERVGPSRRAWGGERGMRVRDGIRARDRKRERREGRMGFEGSTQNPLGIIYFCTNNKAELGCHSNSSAHFLPRPRGLPHFLAVSGDDAGTSWAHREHMAERWHFTLQLTLQVVLLFAAENILWTCSNRPPAYLVLLNWPRLHSRRSAQGGNNSSADGKVTLQMHAPPFQCFKNFMEDTEF